MLRFRIISAIVILTGVALAATCLPPLGVLLFTIVLSTVSQLEFYRFMRAADIPVHRFLGVVCGAVLLAVTMFTIGSESDTMLRAYRWEQIILVAIVFSVFVAYLFDAKCENPIAGISCTLLGILYVPYLFNFYPKLAYGFEHSTSGISETGRMLIFYSVVVIKTTDIGAYFTGRMFGKHKMFPRVSPAKTWEGLAGGIVWTVVISVVFWKLSLGELGMIKLSMFHAVVLGIVLAIAGVLGDLFESLIKRAAGTKDSGTKVPGMGGILDVFDSLFFGVPVLYIYIKLFLDVS